MSNTDRVLSDSWKVFVVALGGWIIPSFIVLAAIFVYPEQATSQNPFVIPALALGAVAFGCWVRLLKEREIIDG